MLQDTASAAQPQETSHLQPRLPQNDVPRKRTASSHDLSPSTKRQGSVSNLENYFKLMPTSSKAPEIEPTQIPDVATDVATSSRSACRVSPLHCSAPLLRVTTRLYCSALLLRFTVLLHCSALLLVFTVALFCSASLFYSTAPRCY